MIKLTAGVQVSPQMLDGAEGGGSAKSGHALGITLLYGAGFVMFKQGRVFARATRWKQTIALKSAAYCE